MTEQYMDWVDDRRREIAAALGLIPDNVDVDFDAIVRTARTMREQNDSIPALLENIDRLTKAVNDAPEFLEAVKIATNAETAQLRVALGWALDALVCVQQADSYMVTAEQGRRIAELRKLVDA